MANTATFTLYWIDPETDDEFVSEHQYHGRGEQSGYSRTGWMLRCIARRKSETGWLYDGSHAHRRYSLRR
jgi:hypothetical protein